MCALQGSDQVLSSLINGVVKLSKHSYQNLLSSQVKDTNEKTRKVTMVNKLKQLRLRAPNMIRREYQDLVDKVKQPDEEPFDQNQLLPSQIQNNQHLSAFKSISLKKLTNESTIGGGFEGLESSQISLPTLNLKIKENSRRNQGQKNASSHERMGPSNLDESSVFMTEGGIPEREDNSDFYSVSPVNASINSTLREFRTQ